MKMKTSELQGAALDWAVCEATGLLGAYPLTRKRFLKQWSGNSGKYLHPSTDWAQGGPIIEREAIQITPDEYSGTWVAFMTREGNPLEDRGPTPLIAATRCFVSSRLGDTVEVPDELC